MEKSKIKSIIVEDETYDLQLVQRILTSYYNDYIDLVDSVSSVEQAIASINKYRPQLLFMDIELNGDRNGAFNILEKAGKGVKVIFVTAKSDQDDLLKAIRLSCIDYLIKPTKISDFEIPVKKVFQEVNQAMQGYWANIEVLKHNIETRNLSDVRISLQEGFSYRPVPVKEIIRCESEGNYTRVYFVGNSNSLINGNLKSFEDRLNGYGFCRINKTDLVNLSHLKSFSKKNSTWQVSMSDKKTLYISSNRKQGFLLKYNNMNLIY